MSRTTFYQQTMKNAPEITLLFLNGLRLLKTGKVCFINTLIKGSSTSSF